MRSPLAILVLPGRCSRRGRSELSPASTARCRVDSTTTGIRLFKSVISRMRAERSPIGGALLRSGVYALEPVRLSSRNDALGLTAKEARALSPVHRIPDAPCPVVLGWGEEETDEFRRPSHDFAAAWRRAGGPCNARELPGANHFDMSLELADPNGPILKSFLELCGASEAMP